MEIIKIQDNKQKIIIISLIVSQKFCEKIIPIIHNNYELIHNSFTGFYKIILNWCIDYFIKYHKAIHEHIEEYYLSNVNLNNETDNLLLSEFLKQLSNKYVRDEKFNEDFIIDESLKYLREINLNILTKKINEAKENNKIDEAENYVLTFNKLENETESVKKTFVFSDIEEACKICNFKNILEEDDRLFKFKGDLGNKIGWISRGDFFCVTGVPKIGKSFILREIALLCIEYGLNVVLFNLEMSHQKYLLNFYQNITNEIRYLEEDEENVKIKIPYFELNKYSNKYDIKYEELTKYGLSSKKIKNIFKKQRIKNKGDILVKSYPSGTLSYQKMAKTLDDLILENFVVDVVLIDFLDNLKDSVKGDFRHSINEKWLLTRRLAQEKHIICGTVSHANRKNFKQDLQRGDVNEDYRKEAHVTLMIGVNQTAEDKNNQVTRINILHNRDNDFDPKEMFISLESRSIGKVLIDNLSQIKVNYNLKKEK